MGWFQAGALGLGLFDSLTGSKPNQYSPWQQADASWRVNNPNQITPFGSVNYRVDDMGTPERMRDDVYSVEQTLSPEMQALADRLLGMAGRGREEFSSAGMGSRLSNRLNRVLGTRSPASYNRGEYGFGQGAGPVQVPEEPLEEDLDPNALAQALEGSSFDINDFLARSRAQYGVGGFGGPVRR